MGGACLGDSCVASVAGEGAARGVEGGRRVGPGRWLWSLARSVPGRRGTGRALGRGSALWCGQTSGGPASAGAVMSVSWGRGLRFPPARGGGAAAEAGRAAGGDQARPAPSARQAELQVTSWKP